MKGTNKYHAAKYGGCDSKKEWKRWQELQAMQERGEIDMLQRQVEFTLIPSQKIDGKVVERAVKYRADFMYTQNNELVVEDVKGCRKGAAYQLFVIKRKMMLWSYGIRVKET